MLWSVIVRKNGVSSFPVPLRLALRIWRTIAFMGVFDSLLFFFFSLLLLFLFVIPNCSYSLPISYSNNDLQTRQLARTMHVVKIRIVSTARPRLNV